MNSILDETEIKSLPSNHVLYFHATWLPRSISVPFYRMVDSVVSAFGSSAVAIDVESFRQLCKIYDVTMVPTALLVKDGKIVRRLEGHMLTSAFRAAMREVYEIDKSMINKLTHEPDGADISLNERELTNVKNKK